MKLIYAHCSYRVALTNIPDHESIRKLLLLCMPVSIALVQSYRITVTVKIGILLRCLINVQIVMSTLC